MVYTKKYSTSYKSKTYKRRYKKTKRIKKSLKKKNKKQRGGINDHLDNSFSVMTFNIELFLKMYQFTMDPTDDKKIANATIDERKKHSFNNLFNDIDVLCLQEFYKSTESGFPRFKNPIDENKLSMVSSCQSGKVGWDRSIFLYGQNSYLANSIFINPQKIEFGQKQNALNEKIISDNVQRCFSSITIIKNETPIKIISVHLTGGRFDDIDFILKGGENIKLQQIDEIVTKQSPDIICGDFNTKLRASNTTESTNQYFISLLKSLDLLNPELHVDHEENIQKMEFYRPRWESWIYMDTIHNYLLNNGYLSAYYDANGNLIRSMQDKDTSAFGGIVDMIYYKKNALTLVENSVGIVGEEVVMKKNPNSSIYIQELSDHYPVKASFIVRPTNINKETSTRDFSLRKTISSFF